MIRKAFYLVGMVILLISCLSTEKLIADKSNNRIYFGKTGGFTNIPMEYVLIEKAHLFKVENDSLVKVRKLSGKQIKALDSLIKDLNAEQFSINEPGNITYHIKFVSTGSEKDFRWSDSSENIKIKELYKALIATVKE